VTGQFEDAMFSGIEGAQAVADDRAAIAQVVDLWLTLFGEYEQRFRAFMVEAHDQTFHHARGRQASHTISQRLSEWLVGRFGCTPATAQACYAVLLGLGASRALWDPDEVSADPLSTDVLAREVGTMIFVKVTSPEVCSRPRPTDPAADAGGEPEPFGPTLTP
jgi:hypothetical protein